MKTLDEAMRKAGQIHNAYAGRHSSDGAGADVARKIVASLAADGWVLVPQHVPHWAIDWPEEDDAAPKPGDAP